MVAFDRFEELEAQRTRIDMDLAGVTAALAGLETNLEEQPKTLTTSRNLVEDPAYQQAMAKLARSDIGALLGVNLQTDFLCARFKNDGTTETLMEIEE